MGRSQKAGLTLLARPGGESDFPDAVFLDGRLMIPGVVVRYPRCRQDFT